MLLAFACALSQSFLLDILRRVAMACTDSPLHDPVFPFTFNSFFHSMCDAVTVSSISIEVVFLCNSLIVQI